MVNQEWCPTHLFLYAHSSSLQDDFKYTTTEHALHVIFVRSDFVVRALQLLFKRLVLVQLRLPLLCRCYHPFTSSLIGSEQVRSRKGRDG